MLRVTLLCAVSVVTARATCPSYAGRRNVVHGRRCGPPTACTRNFTYPLDEKVPSCLPCTEDVSPYTVYVTYSKVRNGINGTSYYRSANLTTHYPCDVCTRGLRIFCNDDGDGDTDGTLTNMDIVLHRKNQATVQIDVLQGERRKASARPRVSAAAGVWLLQCLLLVLLVLLRRFLVSGKWREVSKNRVGCALHCSAATTLVVPITPHTDAGPLSA